jgi:pyruvate kinase
MTDFEIVETDKKSEVIARVIQGGELKSKGVNLPNTKISLPAMTEKDIADNFAIGQNVVGLHCLL